jgi:hypothetical protein
MNDQLPTLRDQARAAITTILVTTGRQIPARVEPVATLLLVDEWTAGLVHGVQPQDWQAVSSLPTACLDAVVLVEARRRDNLTAD